MSAAIETNEPANLPAVAPTGFPVCYEEARQAIAKCESPFECRTMADQAAAMAVYARMRDDTDLQNRAVRLQAWAARRWGELDRALHPDRRQANLKQGPRNVVDHNSVELPKNSNFGNQPESGKRPLPPDGTTEYQRVVSRRLAAIPEPEFTRQVESENPPTLTQLAAQGKVTRVRDPEYSQVTDTSQPLRMFAQFAASHDAAELAQSVTAAEVRIVREMVTRSGRWLTTFWDNLPAEHPDEG